MQNKHGGLWKSLKLIKKTLQRVLGFFGEIGRALRPVRRFVYCIGVKRACGFDFRRNVKHSIFCAVCNVIKRHLTATRNTFRKAAIGADFA